MELLHSNIFKYAYKRDFKHPYITIFEVKNNRSSNLIWT